MKKLVFITLLLVVGVATSAQQTNDKKKATTGMSIGAELALPIGDFADISGIGIGGSAKLAIPVGDGNATLSAGYVNFSAKDFTVAGITVKGSSTYLIPIKAGYRFNLGEGGFNFEPQAGYSVGKNSGGGFTYAGNIGYLINNQVDLSLRYEGVSKSGGSIAMIGLRVAYHFSF